MSELRLYDTLARKKRVFEPADPARVTMYVCGPTVYNRAHIGNARPAVVFDVLARLLRHLYGESQVVYARNVTDVDDKIIKAAADEGVDASMITNRYERHYLDDMGALGVAPPDLAPHATEHVPDMIAMIARLIETGNAYEADGHVLFHVPSDPDYGALGRRDRDAMIAGARVEVAGYKRDPSDFVLWKPSPPEMIGWDSPWGRGRPGWHIECSAMIERHLGETVDIHGGGLDLIFPHHENELAQSRCVHGGAPLARYWLHNGFLSMAGPEKMSKSLGNVVTVGDLLAQGHKGEVLRLALLSAHYRQPLEWSDQLIAQSKATLDRWYRVLELCEHEQATPHIDPERVAQLTVFNALADDLNTPKAVSELSNYANALLVFKSGTLGVQDDLLQDTMSAFLSGASLLGLLSATAGAWFRGEMNGGIDERIATRTAAKNARDFAEADRIRAELAEEGVLLEDTPAGTTWRRA